MNCPVLHMSPKEYCHIRRRGTDDSGRTNDIDVIRHCHIFHAGIVIAGGKISGRFRREDIG